MKIASFNINNINRRLSNLLDWLREAEPDMVCLQELKTADAEFPTQAIRQAGYHAVCRGERRWMRPTRIAAARPIAVRPPEANLGFTRIVDIGIRSTSTPGGALQGQSCGWRRQVATI